MLTFDDTSVSTGDHLEVMDVLYRFGAGVDRNDEKLLDTAFDEDAEVDFGPCGRKMGLDFPVMTNGETIVRFLGATSRAQTTSHVITNGRVHVEGGVAKLRALVDATHMPKVNVSRRCRMMNWYDADLIRDPWLWRIRRLVIDNVWFDGDPQVLLGT